MIFLRGKQLQAMYKPCYLDAQASATAGRPRAEIARLRDVIASRPMLAPHDVIWRLPGMALARARNWPYLNAHGSADFHPARNDRRQPGRRGRVAVGDRLGRRRPRRAVSCSAPLALWFHYGTAVFFEMIAAGISACF